jgi:pyruvate-formate lyase-activating enzyme
MVTRRCNIACGHCSVESGPAVKEQASEEDLVRYVHEAATAGVRSILLTGGEPMLREKIVLRMLRECRKLNIATIITTNGFWGKTPRSARAKLRALCRAGLDGLTVSYDRYHAEFQGPEPALNIARAAEEIRFAINVNITRVADESDLDEIVTAFEGIGSVRLRFYDVQPVGRARELPAERLRAEVEGFCSSCGFPAITSNGRLTACNGPAFFAKADSPLAVGSLAETPLAELLQRHRQDPILETIRAFGPAGLRDELRRIDGFQNFFRPHYQGMCELCHHITSHPDAVRALRAKLADPQLAARRLVVRKVISGSRTDGVLNRDYVNGIGACRAFLHALMGDIRWSAEAEQILGRADIDWAQIAHYLSECGLAGPLMPLLSESHLTRWAPNIFSKRIEARAQEDTAREPLALRALDCVSRALRELNGRALLLNSTAQFAVKATTGPATRFRSIDQIELCVERSLDRPVRDKLLAMGAHLDSRRRLNWYGLPISIETRIMPASWSLPDAALLVTATAVHDADGGPFVQLDPSGQMLHAAMEASRRLFSHGLSTAWDLSFALRADVDWSRLADWVSRSRVPRGFWTPIRVLGRELGLPIPSEFLAIGPADRRQQKLERTARQRLFTASDGPSGLRHFKRNLTLFRLGGSRLTARELVGIYTA